MSLDVEDTQGESVRGHLRINIKIQPHIMTCRASFTSTPFSPRPHANIKRCQEMSSTIYPQIVWDAAEVLGEYQDLTGRLAHNDLIYILVRQHNLELEADNDVFWAGVYECLTPPTLLYRSCSSPPTILIGRNTIVILSPPCVIWKSTTHDPMTL